VTLKAENLIFRFRSRLQLALSFSRRRSEARESGGIAGEGRTGPVTREEHVNA
jgi:hypothetical protein